MVEHVAGLEGGRVVRIVVIGVLANLDQRGCQQRFQQHHTRLFRHRVQHRRVGGNRTHEGTTPDGLRNARTAAPSMISTTPYNPRSDDHGYRTYSQAKPAAGWGS